MKISRISQELYEQFFCSLFVFLSISANNRISLFQQWWKSLILLLADIDKKTKREQKNCSYNS